MQTLICLQIGGKIKNEGFFKIDCSDRFSKIRIGLFGKFLLAMSKLQVETALLLLRDHFGTLVSGVGAVLLRGGSLPLPLIAFRSKLPVSKVRTLDFCLKEQRKSDYVEYVVFEMRLFVIIAGVLCRSVCIPITAFLCSGKTSAHNPHPTPLCRLLERLGRGTKPECRISVLGRSRFAIGQIPAIHADRQEAVR